ncbi:MAG: SPOR domain-containing protein [Alphaproteobacteria bacterium PRO2]|nr:SPOR domain-containing protein [Alphaproteobacteria bacterium PRO2]
MIKRNPYLQHTYESFDQPVPPRRHSHEESLTERVFGPELAARFRSPLFATAALLVTGVAFAGIIIASYPDSDAPDGSIPVITADASPLREAPSEPGGMDVANEDSTIFNSIRSAELQETAPIENLLADEQPVNTQTAFADGQAAAAVEPAAGDLQPAPQAEKIIADAGEAPPPSEMADATKEIEEAGEPKVPDVTVAETRSIPMKSEKTPLANADKPTMAPAATTPETLDYVRSVLEKKDAGTTKTASADAAAARVAATEPASGAATSAGAAISPGSSFVQLASISSESAAPKEWTKLQKTFPSLSGLEYRVQRADLGAKGVFYRIQAGPMSKDSAKSVCDSVKAQKPGGCIVVQ